MTFKRIFFSPVNPEIHVCHLHRLGLKDKEGIPLDLLVPHSPFQLAVKNPWESFQMFCVYKGAPETAAICTGSGREESPLLSRSGSSALALQNPQSLQVDFHHGPEGELASVSQSWSGMRPVAKGWGQHTVFVSWGDRSCSLGGIWPVPSNHLTPPQPPQYSQL